MFKTYPVLNTRFPRDIKPVVYDLFTHMIMNMKKHKIDIEFNILNCFKHMNTPYCYYCFLNLMINNNTPVLSIDKSPVLI
jgi:hypothetical protein